MGDLNVTLNEKFAEEFSELMISQIQLINQRVVKTLTNLIAFTQ